VRSVAYFLTSIYNLIMKKGVRKTNEKYVTEKTFEKSMVSIAKSFVRINEALERHERVLEMILKELKNLRDDHREIRSALSNLEIGLLKYDRKLEDLTLRVEKLEMRIK